MIQVFAALDPHHIGPQVGEQTGAERAGEHVGEIQHANSGQRSGWSGFDGCLHGVILVEFLISPIGRRTPRCRFP